MTLSTSVGKTSELRWGVLGCGVIANEMAQALKLQGRTIDAVANRTYDKAISYAREYGIPKVYRTAEELFADPEVDAVYITTPHNTHIAYLRLALAAKKHVVCEKAITLNSDELDEAIALADANGVVLMDACTVLHMPLYKELALRVRAGEFGRVNLIQENFGSFKDYDERNRFFNPDLAGGAMLDIGVYSLTLMRLFMESAPNERLSLMNPAPTGVDMTSGLLLRNEQGQMGVISLSLRSKQPKRAVISCEKAYIEVMEYPRADSATIVWTETGKADIVCIGERDKALCYVINDLETAVADAAAAGGTAAGDATASSATAGAAVTGDAAAGVAAADATAAGDTAASSAKKGEDSQLANELMQIEITSDVMRMMTDFRRDWGFFYPEEL